MRTQMVSIAQISAARQNGNFKLAKKLREKFEKQLRASNLHEYKIINGKDATPLFGGDA